MNLLKKFNAMFMLMGAIFSVSAESIITSTKTADIYAGIDSFYRDNSESITYNPFFGSPYELFILKRNFMDDSASPSHYTFIGEKSELLINYNYESSNFLELMANSFYSSVYGALATSGTTTNATYNNLTRLLNMMREDPYSINDIYTTIYSDLSGLYFFTFNAELYLVKNGLSTFPFNDIIGMTDDIYFTYDFWDFSGNRFNEWYANSTFSDKYGLVTKNITPQANAVRDYSISVLTSPRKFSTSELISKSSNIIYIPRILDEFLYWEVSYLDPAGFNGTTWVSVDVILDPKTEHFGSLLEAGVIDNIYEAELFNVWFRLEYMLADIYPLWIYAQSGQSALSINQLAIDTALPMGVVNSTILKQEVAKESTAGSGDDITIITHNANNPVADTSILFFNAFNRLGNIFKTNVGYDFIFPEGKIELGVDLNSYTTFLPYQNEDYQTLDLIFKGQFNFLNTFFAESHLFVTGGITLNEATLMANYINSSAGVYQDFYFGPINISIGEIIYSKYWSQFPQLELKSISAMRMGVELGTVGIVSDVIYTRTIGSVYKGEWNPYEGANLNNLKVGLGVDLHIGDSVSLNIGTRKDFLMENFSSLEFSLGGAFVF